MLINFVISITTFFFGELTHLLYNIIELCFLLPTYKGVNWQFDFQVLFREDATVDDLIDVIEGNRKYMKCVYVYNKIDVIGIDDVDRLARQPNSVVISCNLKVG